MVALEAKIDGRLMRAVDEKPRSSNRDNPSLDRKRMIDVRIIMPLITVYVTGAQASVASSKPNVELDSHAGTSTV